MIRLPGYQKAAGTKFSKHAVILTAGRRIAGLPACQKQEITGSCTDRPDHLITSNQMLQFSVFLIALVQASNVPSDGEMLYVSSRIWQKTDLNRRQAVLPMVNSRVKDNDERHCKKTIQEKSGKNPDQKNCIKADVIDIGL